MDHTFSSSSNKTKHVVDKDDFNQCETNTDADFPLHNAVDIATTTQPTSGGRVRLYSESQVCTVSQWEDAEAQDGCPVEEGGGAGDGAPFRGRSQSAPAALWAAKKYGRQLRRMSDEFDTWLDRGELKRVSSPGRGTQKQARSRGWFSFLWSSKEEEGRE